MDLSSKLMVNRSDEPDSAGQIGGADVMSTSKTSSDELLKQSLAALLAIGLAPSCARVQSRDSRSVLVDR